MPLDPQPGPADGFDGLHRAVLGPARGQEPLARLVDGLVVQGVDPPGRAVQPGHLRPLGEGHCVDRLVGRPVEAGVGPDVLVQSPPAVHVEELDAPADPRHRDAGGGRRVHQPQLEGVAVRLGREQVGPDLLPVPGRVYVGAPGEQQPVEAADEGLGVRRLGHVHRQPARGHHPQGVIAEVQIHRPAGHALGGHPQLPGQAAAPRDPDQRRRHGVRV